MPPEIQSEAQSEIQAEVQSEIQPIEKVQPPVQYDEAAIRKAEIERKKAELRKRMEEASKARRAKTGFMTPERKKKLRLLLRRKAAEELKKEQERKAEERRWIIEDRCGDPEDLDWASKDDLIDICQDYFERILECESEKWDLEHEIRKRAFEIGELNSKVNDLRGKFQKPILKKVSKYENKFSLLQRKAAEFNIKNQLHLKSIRKTDFTLKDGDDKKSLHGDRKEDETKSEIGEEIETGEASEAEDKVEESSPGDGEGEKLPEGVEGDVNAEVDVLPDGLARLEGEEHLDGEKRLEGEERLDGVEPRLEGETALDGEAGVEGESRLGGQSPVEGEVQPSEESYEPPPPPVPEHTAEDLWLYLKESVTSEHPSTVQEFLENLIGTLQQVPEEYLKPVIDANIKRATSPSVTDGEHLTTPDGIPLQKNEVSAESLECALRAEGESSLTAESETATTTGGPEIEGAQTEVSSEFLNPEDTSEATEGSAAVEAGA